MSRAFEDSSLWRTAFGPRTKDKHADQRKFLEIAYRQFREAVLPLLRQTAIDIPALTIHDETHVDQLWDVASEICGTDYPLNPLEAFIVGGAFLLHDSALCVAAYENSVTGLMQTNEWYDSVARLWHLRGIDKPSEQQRLLPPEDLKNAAIFEVLRRKHSQQASILIDRTWKHPITGRPILLLENAQLQEDYGKLVGQIAASHHWQVKLVEDSFPIVIPASANWPREWEIDPLKLACILRCADAAAIDERRAPSRLFAFRPPTDTSRRHWAFQNNLYPASLEQETLVFISKTPFELASMEDWWLCFDAVNVVDQELRASNASLAAHNRPPFAARQAFGANIAEDFQKKVSVTGWTPVETSLRASDIPSIIKRFGGTKLYGDDAEALFRELIQNGADAIRARRRRDLDFRSRGNYSGQVRVQMKFLEDDATTEISFEDDGIGMPPSVLTGPLLDFGTSFWNTELAATLYPGLQSDPEFRPVGKYGIGFFSAFMFSDYAQVMSRPFIKGRDDLFVLIFKHGLNGRAQLRPYDRRLDGDVEEQFSTIVTIRIPTAKLFESLRSPIWDMRRSKPARTLDDIYNLVYPFLCRLCFGLDVLVQLEMQDGSFADVNEPFYGNWSNEAFVAKLDKTFLDGKSLPLKLARCVEPLTNDDGQFCGRACISIGVGSSLVRTIGGFARKRLTASGGSWGVGILEQTPTVASRNEGKLIADPSTLNRWASKQLDHIVADMDNFTATELYHAAAHLSRYDVDPLPIAHYYLVDRVVPIAECVRVLKKEKKLIFLVEDLRPFDRTEKFYRLCKVSDVCAAIAQDHGELIEPVPFVRSASALAGYAFERMSEDFSTDESNLLSCFLRLLKKNSIRSSVSFQEKVPIGRYSGFPTKWTANNEIVYAKAVVVSLESSQRKPRRK